MATVYESNESSVGDRRSLSGLEATRTFVVINDTLSPSEDATAHVEALHAYGQQHPQERFKGLQVVEYVRRSKEPPLAFWVDVVYGSPGSPEFNGWRISARFNSGTESAKRDLDNKPIGSYAYRPLKDGEVADPASGSFYVLGETTGGIQKHVPLVRTGRFNLTGLDRFRQNGSIIIQRRLPTMRADIIRAVYSWRNIFNLDPFMADAGTRLKPRDAGWEPRTMLFVDFNFEPAEGILPGQTVKGLVWDCQLEFLFNDKKSNTDGKIVGWEWEELFDTWKDEEGFDNPVFQVAAPADLLVSRTFRAYDGDHLDQLFTDALGTDVPRFPSPLK